MTLVARIGIGWREVPGRRSSPMHQNVGVGGTNYTGPVQIVTVSTTARHLRFCFCVLRLRPLPPGSRNFGATTLTPPAHPMWSWVPESNARPLVRLLWAQRSFLT